MPFTFTHRNPEMRLEKKHTALVFADLQNEFLESSGSYYPMIEDKLEELKVYDHIEELLKCAQENDIYVVHSPHYYYPTDRQWTAPGSAIVDYLSNLPEGFVGRKDPVDLEGFHGSGADYPERLKKYLMDGKTVNTSPHKGLSCLSNDLIKQLRLRRIEKVIVAGPVGNLCLENHVRDILEYGFEIAVVRDAIAGPKNDEGDGYAAAMTNYRFITNAMWTTKEAITKINALA
jgi:nicotinamidase-related amidase